MGTRLGNWLLPHEVSGGSVGIPLGDIGGKFEAHQLSLELFSQRGTDPTNIAPSAFFLGKFLSVSVQSSFLKSSVESFSQKV
jgi:hypothetical protein